MLGETRRGRVIFAILAPLFATSAHSAQVTVTINNILQGGEIQVALYSSAERFPDQPCRWCQQAPARPGKLHFNFLDIPPGEYAIAVYQDVNSNGQLDKNFVGMPKEPYGFSRNARGRFGSPEFKDAGFKVNGQDVIKEIELK